MSNSKNKEKSSNNIKKTDYLLIALIIILVIVIGILIFTKIKNRGIYKTNDKRIVELHDYFSTNSLEDCSGLFNYATEKVTPDVIDNTTKLCIAYNKTDLENAKSQSYEAKDTEDNLKLCTVDGMVFRAEEGKDTCSVLEVDKKDVNNTYEKIFGSKASDEESFRYNGSHVCYLKNDKYYCGLSKTYILNIGNDVTIYRVVDSAKEKDGILTLYDYFIKQVLDVCYSDYGSQITNVQCTEQLAGKTDLDYEFVKKYGKKYKHVYKKAKDGTFYWVSSEPVE